MKNVTFIIAEAGVNHNGSIDIARKLVDAAAEAEADAIKFQTFRADKLVRPDAPVAAYQKKPGRAGMSQYTLLRELELDEGAHRAIADHCRTRGIQFLSTAFDIDSLIMLIDRFDVSRIKIPSGEITNGPFLLRAARTRKPVILSTGMSTIGEIREALRVLAFGYTNQEEDPSKKALRDAFSTNEGQAAVRKQVTLLHCTSEYPAPSDEVNLHAMASLKAAFGTAVGLSDHSEGIYAAVAAAALGATIIEKHFTLDRSLPGPDHKASVEPGELGEMVHAIRAVERYLGSERKGPTPSEMKNRDIVRKSLVADRPIKKGELFSPENLTFKRPGKGLSPMAYWKLLGKRSERDYDRDEMILDTARRGK